jgi:hypothetical protein
MAELAVLTVVARQCQRAGVCVLPIDAIAALAGCSRTSVKNAMRQASLLGLILVKERRIPSRKSLTNIVSKEWLGWLRMGGGVKKLTATIDPLHSTIAPCIQRGNRKFRASAGAARPSVGLAGEGRATGFSASSRW